MSEVVERRLTEAECEAIDAERERAWAKMRQEIGEARGRRERGEKPPAVFLPPPEPYYRDNEVALYLGDCVEVMRNMPDNSFELVFTSPPYNLGVSTGGGMSRASAKTGQWQSAKLRSGYENHADAMPWPEYVEWQKSVLTECWRLLSDTGAIFYNHKPRVPRV